MALGDADDILAKLKRALVARWFASFIPGSDSSTPVLDGVLSGPAWMWSWLYDLLQYVAKQRRIGTADGVNLDQICFDFFGQTLGRFTAEGDDAFRNRIKANLLAPKNTRAALINAVTTLTGVTPTIFEPRDTTDTGGYGHLGMTQGTGLGYGLAGGYGSLLLPFQAFVTAYRPVGIGIASVGGYYSVGSALPALGGYGVGAIEYASLDMLAGLVTDADIYQTIAAVAPEATIMWTRITDKVAPTQVFVLGIGRLFEKQADQTISAAAFQGSYVGRVIETQANQTLSASANLGIIRGTLGLAQQPQGIIASGSVPSTWNSQDATNVSISADHLTASTISSTQGGVRSTSSISTGQRYLEIKTTSALVGERVGFATSAWSETTQLGSDTHSIGIAQDGSVWFGNAVIGSTTPWVAGATLCLAVDDDAKAVWSRVNGGAWAGLIGSVSGSHSVGTTGPIITGPVSGEVSATSTLGVGVTVTDSIWPRSGNVILLVSANAGTLSMTVGGSSVPGSGTSNISYSDTSTNISTALSTLVYTAGSIAGSDNISITVQDQVGNKNTLGISMAIAAQPDPSADVGGFSYAGITAGNLFAAYSVAVTGASVTADFGATTFQFAEPAGYSPWSGSAGSGAPQGAFVVTTSAETSTSVSLSWTPAGTGGSSGSGSGAPPQAAAVGYNTMTFGPAVQPLGTALRPFSFFGTVPGTPTSNADGSITITTPSTGFGADLCTAGLKNGATTWPDFHGIAFGGGCYAEAVMSMQGANVNPGMSFWLNDIESMNGGSVGDLTGRQWPGQATGFGNWIEVDIAEFDASGDSYGCGNHNWYGTASAFNDANTGSYPGFVSPVTPGTGIDWSKPHRYGWLWVPATGGSTTSTNVLPNSNETGAVVGTPGTLPTGWDFSRINGLSFQVVATGTSGGNPSIDIRVFGTADGSSDINLFLCPKTGFTATPSTQYNFVVGLAVVAGTLPGNPVLDVDNLQSNGNYIGSTTGSGLTLTSTPTDFTLPLATTSNTGLFNCQVAFFGPASGTAVDFTLRIVFPRMLQLSAPTSASGYQKFFFDGVQVGTTMFWNQWSSSETPPPVQGSTAYNVLDTRHVAFIFGCGDPARPVTVHSLQVWQASSANNITG